MSKKKKQNKKAAPARRSTGNKKTGGMMNQILDVLKDPKILMGIAAGVVIPFAIEKYGKKADGKHYIENVEIRNLIKAAAPALLIGATVKDKNALISAAGCGIAVSLGGYATDALNKGSDKMKGLINGQRVYAQTEGQAGFPPSQITDAEIAGMDEEQVNGEFDEDVNGSYVPDSAVDGFGGYAVEGSDMDRSRD